MFASLTHFLRRSPIAIAAAASLAASVAAAGAATVHRYATTTGSGSLGAFSYNNTTANGGALQGSVSSSPISSIKIPFGVLGDYATPGTFGIGVAGVSVSGYGVGAETFGGGASIIGIQNGSADAADLYNKTDGSSAQLAASTGEGLIAIGTSGSESTAAVTADTAAAGTAIFSGSATYGGGNEREPRRHFEYGSERPRGIRRYLRRRPGVSKLHRDLAESSAGLDGQMRRRHVVDDERRRA